jgi:hypothetical protein
VRHGVESKRFAVDDPVAAVLAACGAVLAVIAAQLHGDIGDDAAERAAAVVLRMLGIPGAEAREIAHRPLPPIDTGAQRETENGRQEKR